MKIIIVGGGKIGTVMIQSLLAEGHDLVVIDNDPAVIEQISNVYDVMCVLGNALDGETLTEAGVENTHLLVAVTGSDEFNMLCCFLAKRLGIPHTIARVRNPEYNEQGLAFMRQQLDLSLAINPDALAAREIFHLLQLPVAEGLETFSRRNFEMVEITLKPDTPLDGLSLMEMRRRFPASYLVGTVRRGEEVFIPAGSFQLKAGDQIGLAAAPAEIERLLKMLGLMQKKARNVMIVGASRTAYYLARRLLAGGNSVTIVEKNKGLCQSFAETLPEAVVVCGDAAQAEFLLEEGLESMDGFVSLTGMDEENLLLSYLAGSHGVKKVISKINREEFFSMAYQLGLDSLVSPRKLVSDVITRYARALENSIGSRIETLYKLMDGKAEAMEFKVEADFQYLGIPLKDMKIKSNTLVAGIVRGRRTLIPSGADCISAGDRVIVFTANNGLGDLKDIVERS